MSCLLSWGRLWPILLPATRGRSRASDRFYTRYARALPMATALAPYVERGNITETLSVCVDSLSYWSFGYQANTGHVCQADNTFYKPTTVCNVFSEAKLWETVGEFPLKRQRWLTLLFWLKGHFSLLSFILSLCILRTDFRIFLTDWNAQSTRYHNTLYIKHAEQLQSEQISLALICFLQYPGTPSKTVKQ